MAEKKLTPMMQQWHEIRAKLSDDTLLLFRLGDFYEIFQQDAERGAKLLGITLTHRHGMPMAGIPFHAADTYLQKLLDQGIKIAICDQTETPKPGKLVKRELTRFPRLAASAWSRFSAFIPVSGSLKTYRRGPT